MVPTVEKASDVDADDSQQPTPDYWHLTTMQEPTTTTDSDTWQSAVRTRQSTYQKLRPSSTFTPAFRHSGIYCGYDFSTAYCISSTTPEAAVYWHKGCISFHLQFGLAGCIPFHTQQFGRAGCIPFHLHKFVKCRNVSYCRTVQHSVSPVPECQCRNQSGTGMLQYRTEMLDAGMPAAPDLPKSKSFPS
jgi:hypothetical protein